MKPCIIDDCDRPQQVKGMCQRHYLKAWRHRGSERPACNHLDCTAEAVYRIDWPQREHPEKVCGPHTKPVRQAMIPYVTITRIEEP